MRERKKANIDPRMIGVDQASFYIGHGRSKTMQIMETIGAKRRIGRRVVYDKVVIDRWLDSLAADQEGAE